MLPISRASVERAKGIGLDRDFSRVPTGSCNCVCVFGRYSTTRCSPGRITTAINPQQFICFRKAYYRERVLLLGPENSLVLSSSFSPTLPEGPNCLLFKGGPLAIGQAGNLVSPPLLIYVEI
ncbi:hypothetical protein AVEN_217704-1 [Araneus ventricosus]|uniref:Uncharacterized protein n=1 Tax=Araneus ventricosus TaxID=182803 RepID=A0A4Y2TI14_ARAVE|nr:hypothetical protein AVEN_217704-1 [Araneus ventricosus]